MFVKPTLDLGGMSRHQRRTSRQNQLVWPIEIIAKNLELKTDKTNCKDYPKNGEILDNLSIRNKSLRFGTTGILTD